MDALELPFALFGFLGFVAVIPAWMYFVHSYEPVQGLPLEVSFLATLFLPASVLFYLASWLQPG